MNINYCIEIIYKFQVEVISISLIEWNMIMKLLLVHNSIRKYFAFTINIKPQYDGEIIFSKYSKIRLWKSLRQYCQ